MSITKPLSKKPTVLSKKPTVWKSFRLFDFETSDRAMGEEDDSASSEDDSPRSQNNKKFKENTFVVQMFGINEQGETVSITCPNFKPFFYILVGDHWTNRERIQLTDEIKQKVGTFWQRGILDTTLEKHCNLYQFGGSVGKEQVYMKMEFQNTTVMNRVKNLWFEPWQDRTVGGEQDRRKPVAYYFPEKGPNRILLKLFESNIPPLLRCFHIHNISPSGWIQLPVSNVTKPSKKRTSCLYEYICSIEQIKAQPEKEDVVPYKICSFDIEASSSHGDFPVPKKNYRRLAIQIVDLFSLHAAGYKGATEPMNKLLKSMIFASFQIGRFNGIDRVFPKESPTQEELELSLQNIFRMIQKKKTTAKEKATFKELIQIDKIFKKCATLAVVDDDGDGDGDDDGDEGDDDEDDGDDGRRETVNIQGKTGKQNTSPDLYKCVSWLNQAEHSREEKVDELNSLLTDHLPELEGDKITFIGSTFVLNGSKQPYLNHCLALGDCAPVAGAEIVSCSTEKELLVKWTELIQKENPDILIGYNIFGFDYDFMFRRSLETDCTREFLALSRNKGHLSAKYSEQNDEWSLEQKKITIASGPFDMKYFNMVGRFQIDLYTYFRREFNLSSYKLDDVSCEFISDKISKYEFCEGNTVLYSGNLKGLQAQDFIHLEIVEYTSEQINDGQKYRVLEIRPETKCFVVEGTVPFPKSAKNTVLRWGLAKDDVSPQDIFRLSNGSAQDKAIVAKYCIQDCNIVQQLLMKIDILTGYNEMARICSVPMKYLVFRGQGIKLTSCLAKYCMNRNTLMPDLTAAYSEETDVNHDYEGAIVLPPKCGMYIDRPVACVDYSSLYPTIIISNNLSQDSKVWSKEYDVKGQLIKENLENAAFDGLQDQGYDYIDIEYDNFVKLSGGKKKLTGKTVCRFAQFPNNQKGIIPSILEDILKARKTTRKMIEKEKDEFMKNILDKRQLAYKVTANSIYGQCGSRTSTFYDKDIAASTTSTGRRMILYAKKMVEDVYGDHRFTHPVLGPLTTSAEYIYGDTDSVFMTFNISKDTALREPILGKPALEITIHLAQEVARLCSMNLKKPMELTYEKTMMPFIILSKKRYVGMLYENDTEHCKLKFMGLSLKRRDCCNYLKDVYGGVLNRFLYNQENVSKRESVASAMQFLQECLNLLVVGQVAIEKLTITKSLRDFYKKPQQIAHWVLANRIGERDPGNKPKPGERMKYVFINVEEGKKGIKQLQGDKIETPDFIHKNGLKINYHYYVTNQLMKPLLQLFGLVAEDILDILGKKADLSKYRKEMKTLQNECQHDMELWMKRKEKIDAMYVKQYLFDPILGRITNQQKGLQTLQTMWGKGPTK